MNENILVEFEDGSAMVFAPKSSVRIANRGPSSVPKKDFEQVRTYPPEWAGFGSFEARILSAGLSKRKLTGWGYGTDTIIGDFSIVGVPALETRLGDYTLAPRSENKSK